MTEEQFWKCTLRKLDYLMKMHLKMHNPSSDPKDDYENKEVFIDQIF